MKRDRELYAEARHNEDWLGPRGADFEAYARHILHFFNRAIGAYTQSKYALQDFLQYVGTQRAISAIVRQLIGGKRTFVFIGDKFIAGNAPVKGYIRTKVRELVREMERHPLCFVYYVDEFRTTKLCSLCYRTLEQPTKRINRGTPNERRRVKKKYRYYLCRGCVDAQNNVDSIEARHHVDSRKSNRQLTRQRRNFKVAVEQNPEIAEAVDRYASKYRRYMKENPKDFSKNKTWNRDVNAGRNIYYIGRWKFKFFPYMCKFSPYRCNFFLHFHQVFFL